MRNRFQLSLLRKDQLVFPLQCFLELNVLLSKLIKFNLSLPIPLPLLVYLVFLRSKLRMGHLICSTQVLLSSGQLVQFGSDSNPMVRTDVRTILVDVRL